MRPTDDAAKGLMLGISLEAVLDTSEELSVAKPEQTKLKNRTMAIDTKKLFEFFFLGLFFNLAELLPKTRIKTNKNIII